MIGGMRLHCGNIRGIEVCVFLLTLITKRRNLTMKDAGVLVLPFSDFCLPPPTMGVYGCFMYTFRLVQPFLQLRSQAWRPARMITFQRQSMDGRMIAPCHLSITQRKSQ